MNNYKKRNQKNKFEPIIVWHHHGSGKELNKINGYTVQARIDSGTQGTVYLATKNGKKYAIKIYTDIKDPIAYNKEVECLKALRDICGKDIVCFVENFELENGDHVVVLEYLEGYVTLKKYLDDKFEEIEIDEETGDMDENSIEKIAENLILLKKIRNRLMKIIGVLRSHNVVHNDFRDENILIKETDDGKLKFKIIDFGMCKIFQKNFINKDYEMLADMLISKMTYYYDSDTILSFAKCILEKMDETPRNRILRYI